MSNRKQCQYCIFSMKTKNTPVKYFCKHPDYGSSVIEIEPNNSCDLLEPSINEEESENILLKTLQHVTPTVMTAFSMLIHENMPVDKIQELYSFEIQTRESKISRDDMLYFILENLRDNFTLDEIMKGFHQVVEVDKEIAEYEAKNLKGVKT